MLVSLVFEAFLISWVRVFLLFVHLQNIIPFIFVTMGPKKKMMSIELKREIVEKHEQGVRVIDLARMYGCSTSMICSELKQELIKGTTPARGVTIISKLRTSLHEKMEKLLTVWVTEKQLQGGTLTQSIMCEKARAIYGDLLKQIPHTSTNEEFNMFL